MSQSSSPTRQALRNVAIIAHVDHGKTTLVDQLLRQSGTLRDNERVAERALDSNELERERGITILAKCTSLTWGAARINIVDTPGHADFGGEVERILSMVDGALLLVDAGEGPMPQTKFVTMKALAQGLRPIVVINKVDRAEAAPHAAQDAVFDLFASLGASEQQLDFPTLFASAKEGWAVEDLAGPRRDLSPLFKCILAQVPPPEESSDGDFALLASLLESDPYLGRVLTGRIARGRVAVNMALKALNPDGKVVEEGRLTKLLAYRGLKRVPISEAFAGDIVAIAGLARASVPDTLCAPEVTAPLTAQPIDPPTLAMTFSHNDSPLAGREGDKVTSRLIRARLMKEAEGNVAVRIRESDAKDAFEVAGRGELQLGVLIETLRREGYELTISRPRVILKSDPDSGAVLEPLEEVLIDLDEPYAGAVVEALGERRAELTDLRAAEGGKQRLTFLAPSRGLIGFHGIFLQMTRGTGVMHRLFAGYGAHRGAIRDRGAGVLISNARGRAVAYALWNIEERGKLFIAPGAEVYPGMIIGENAREQDLEVNPTKTKQLTNIRAAGKDEAIRLTPPITLTLEQALAYIADDESLEVTPKSLRLRKSELDPHKRKRQQKALKHAG